MTKKPHGSQSERIAELEAAVRILHAEMLALVHPLSGRPFMGFPSHLSGTRLFDQNGVTYTSETRQR